MTEESTNAQHPVINKLGRNLEAFYGNIIAIRYLSPNNKVFLLKANSSNELFIEILDLESDASIAFLIKEKISLTGNYLTTNIINHKTSTSSERILWIDRAIVFFVPETMDYIFMKLVRSYPHHKENNTLNIKIDLEGNTLRKEYISIPEVNLKNYDCLNSLVVIPDYNFFNTETFLQKDLYPFFDEYLDEEDFSYIRYTEERCSSFASSTKNLYAIVIFDKDGQSPRGTFCVFEINGDINPKLIFKSKVDDWGSYHVFSEDGKKIAYITNLWEKEGIEINIRTLSEKKFNNEVGFKIQLSIEQRNIEKIFLTHRDEIILVFPERFEMYNAAYIKRKIHLKRDLKTSYEFANNVLLYVHKQQLKIYKV